ncbi:MAG: hypothetical protein ACI9MS_003090, partial [Glaciecola sp.]
SLKKFLTAQKGLFLGCLKHFSLVNHTSMMIGTQSRRPCRAVQLGEAVLLKNPVSPMSFAPKISLFVLKL